MAQGQRNLSALLVFLIGQIVLSAISVQAVTKEDKTFKNLMFASKFDRSNFIDSILTFNWTKNHECLNELNAIKTGVTNREKWAIKRQFDFHKSINFQSNPFFIDDSFVYYSY